MTEAHVGDKIRQKRGGTVEVLAICEDPRRAWVASHLQYGLVAFTMSAPYVVNLADYNLDERTDGR